MDIIITRKTGVAFKSTGRQGYKALVTGTDVKVWDPVGGHYTYCHDLTHRQKSALVREARKAQPERIVYARVYNLSFDETAKVDVGGCLTDSEFDSAVRAAAEELASDWQESEAVNVQVTEDEAGNHAIDSYTWTLGCAAA